MRTHRPADEVFTHLADLRNFAESDPGVRRVTQVEGDGPGPDTVFDVTVAGVGRDLTLRYATVEYGPRLVFGRIGDRAAAGLRRVLDGQLVR